MEGNKLTPAQKAAITRRRNIEARNERERNRRRTITALEAVLQDSESSPGAKENALFLLVTAYRRY